MRPNLLSSLLPLLLAWTGVFRATAGPEDFPVARFDFTRANVVAEWRAVHDVSGLTSTPDGMVIEISGADPYIHGPPADYPTDMEFWLVLHLNAARPGAGQIFWFSPQRGANENDSVRFNVRGGGWEDVRVPLPAVAAGVQLRLDPPGAKGDRVTLAELRIEPRVAFGQPAWPVPKTPELGDGDASIRSGDLVLRHGRQIGGFVLEVAGQRMACGLTPALLGWLDGDQLTWANLAAARRVEVSAGDDRLVCVAAFEDAGGGRWKFRCEFSPAGADALAADVSVICSAERQVVFLPLIGLVAGLGSFGESKDQALFAGLEYLDRDDPSSSEADIIGPGARRQVPDPLKITLPLMAIQAQGRYVGLTWAPDERFAALFDSPDRQFRSGGHVMALLFPGAQPGQRAANDVPRPGQTAVGELLPYAAAPLRPDEPLAVRATLLGGRSANIVPAIQQYVRLRGLPPVPATEWNEYAAKAAAGWLDSALRVDNRYRHALPGGFAPQPAADAAALLAWLAAQSGNSAVRERLDAAARGAVKEVAPAELCLAGVSHVRPPVAPLVFGHVAENVARMRQRGRELLDQFEPDGSVHYRPRAGAPDFGRTHFAPDANGLTADRVARVLEAALFTGDRELREAGLRMLRGLDKFDNTVPRGAQTWEVPLHTPDVLAAAHLVRAYTLGYELSGDAGLLERAEYWAWTGVPFVYLVPPCAGPIGLYATIAVYGATHWTAPNWMGLPVQWCGLVYADALYGLARHAAAGPWRRIADGITASGVQQTWPVGRDAERQGLLPDSLSLRAQVRNDAAINPGTLQACAWRLFERPALYDYRVFRPGDAVVVVHAPGPIEVPADLPGAGSAAAPASQPAQARTGELRFVVNGWPEGQYSVLIVGVEGKPIVRADGKELEWAELDTHGGFGVLKLAGRAEVELSLGS